MNPQHDRIADHAVEDAATQTKLAETTAYLRETLGISGIQLVKAFVKAGAERARFGAINDELRRLQVRVLHAAIDRLLRRQR